MGFCKVLARCFAIAAISTCVLAAPSDDSFVIGLAGSINDGLEASSATKWANATSIRLDAPWSQIEKSPGQYSLPAWLDSQLNAMKNNGIEPVLILDYGNPIYGITKPLDHLSRVRFSNYAEWLVGKLKGRVKYFQLWNEWETRTGGGEPGHARDYVRLAEIVVPRLRIANSEAILISNGISYPGLTSSWLEEFVNQGGAQLFDGIAAHPYVWHQKKDQRPEAAIELLDKVSQMVLKKTGRRIPLYVTEFGYPDFNGKLGTPPSIAAEYMKRFFFLASARPWVKGVWWYGVRDQGVDRSNKEHGFGIFDRAFRPKQTARVMRDIAPHVGVAERGQLSMVKGWLRYRSPDGGIDFQWRPDEAPFSRYEFSP